MWKTPKFQWFLRVEMGAELQTTRFAGKNMPFSGMDPREPHLTSEIKQMAKTKTTKKTAKSVKLSPSAKPRKKSELYNLIAEHTELSRKQVASVFDTLGKVMAVDLAKPGADKPRMFVVPGMMKVQSVYKPATKAREGKNPFTGEMQMFKAKPARTVIKIRPLKALKSMV